MERIKGLGEIETHCGRKPPNLPPTGDWMPLELGWVVTTVKVNTSLALTFLLLTLLFSRLWLEAMKKHPCQNLLLTLREMLIIIWCVLQCCL